MSNIKTGTDRDGRLEIFVRGLGNDEVHHKWQTSAGGAWSDWESLGGEIVSDIEAATNRDGRLEVFAQGTNRAV